MKRDVIVEKGKVVVRANPRDASARVHSLATKRASGAPLTNNERDDLLLAIAQKLGVLK